MAENLKALGRPVKKKAESFTVDFVESKCKSTKPSLQESFLKFKKERQKEIRKEKKMKKKRKKKQRDVHAMMELRRKFMNQAKKYYGVPYAKKYWAADTEEYHSKLFLDCCGLVRQVMRDLEKDFGFRIGPWNQAYMYDTLPITITDEKDMKPGDLVFMSGIYPSPKARQQKHTMTHVEIWAGEGCKTIGARWNNGKVQMWDHYKFEAKSFHSAQYIFKSIDTWLMGTCKSFCKIHKWKRRKFNPTKKSVFALKQQGEIKVPVDNPLQIIGKEKEKSARNEPEMTSHDQIEIVEEDKELEEDDICNDSSSDDDDIDITQDSGSDDTSEDEDDYNALPGSMEEVERDSSVANQTNESSNALGDNTSSKEITQNSYSHRKQQHHIRGPEELELEMKKCFIQSSHKENINDVLGLNRGSLIRSESEDILMSKDSKADMNATKNYSLQPGLQ